MERDIAIRIYNTNFNFVGSVDEWISLIWKSVFNGDVGGFDLELPATKQNIEIFKQDYYVCRSDKESWAVTAKDQGGLSMTHFNDIMIVEAVEISMDDEGRMRLTVGGSHITTILKRRVNLNNFNISDKEPSGFWEALSLRLLYVSWGSNEIDFSENDLRRGLPVEKLSERGRTLGSIPRCQDLGFLSAHIDTENNTYEYNDTIPLGYPVANLPETAYGGEIEHTGELLQVYEYIQGATGFFQPGELLYAEDADYYLLCIPAHTSSGDLSFVKIDTSPQPYRKTFRTHTYYYGSIYATPQWGFRISLTNLARLFGDTITAEDAGRAFLAGKALYGRIPITGLFFCYVVNGDYMTLLLIEYSSPISVLQKSLGIGNDTYFDILSPLCTDIDVGLALYYTKPLNTQPPTLNRPFRFAIYDGEERDVVFSLDNENLLSYTQSLDTQSYSNVAYISAKYPANPTDTDNIREIDLVTYTPIDVSEDILRREIFLNSDASYKDDISGAIVQIDTFRNSLVAEGNSELQSESHSIKHDFDCEILAESSLYELYRDYFVGDKVWVYLPTGEKYQARIQEVTESWNDEGYKVQLKLKYIHKEDATQLLLTESEDILTTEGGDGFLVEEGV